MTRFLILAFTSLVACGPASPFLDAGTPTSVGLACSLVSQCGTLTECKTQSSDGAKTYADGYCTKTCFPNPTSEEHGCPAGAACTPRGNIGEPSDSSGRCLRSCVTPSDCRTGYTCRAIGIDGAKVCAP